MTPAGCSDDPWDMCRKRCQSVIERVVLLEIAAAYPPLFSEPPMLCPTREFMKAFLDPGNGHKLAIFPQYQFGRHRVDFALAYRRSSDRRVFFVVVECDGAAFHDAEKDSARDRDLKDGFPIFKIVRLPAKLINLDRRAAADIVRDAVEEMQRFFAENADG